MFWGDHCAVKQVTHTGATRPDQSRLDQSRHQTQATPRPGDPTEASQVTHQKSGAWFPQIVIRQTTYETITAKRRSPYTLKLSPQR
ncbi:hypothetical protein E2C01_095611 [Portunus trituberculatus]|uniref:Uncharacterized protein n=1 Tax=Portunus trituberculatus TaxID=210409 RepID=A0A5B7JZU5_PORTR|nr:hypothetical protein [Portunus trituberculatus]